MLELTFCDSAAAALKLARHAHPQAGLGETAPLTLALDVGDLSDLEGDMTQRHRVLERLFGFFPDSGVVCNDIWTQNRRALHLISHAPAVRIWFYAASPGDLCGLLYLCSSLRKEVSLHIVSIPSFQLNGSTLIQYRSSGELEPAQLAALCSASQTLSPPIRQACTCLWQELVARNAPLRVLVNGRLIGVAEDFYDFFLRANLPEGDFSAALVLGRTLNQIPGVGDGYLYLRLCEMVASGELQEVAPPDDDHPYSGILRKS